MGERKNESSTSVDLPGFLDWPIKKQVQNIGSYAERLRGDPYQGDWMAGVDPAQMLGNRWTSEAADKLRFGGGGEALYKLGTETAEGKYLDITSNPVFMEYLKSGITDPISKVYSERIRPLQESSQVGLNAFDNLRQGIESAKLGTDEADMIRQATSGATMGLYDLERGYQQGAGDLINAGTAQMLIPGMVKSQAGADQRGLEQSMIDTDLANRYGPLTEIERILQSLTGPAGMYAGTTTTSPGVNKVASTLQGVLGGGSMGSAAGWPGALIGALLGGAGGYFG